MAWRSRYELEVLFGILLVVALAHHVLQPRKVEAWKEDGRWTLAAITDDKPRMISKLQQRHTPESGSLPMQLGYNWMAPV